MTFQREQLLPNSQTASESGISLMNEVEKLLLSGEVVNGMARIASGLKTIRNAYTESDWLSFSKEGFLSHPLTQLIHQDPFTRHSFEKPRGYAGDAELLDYIYGLRQPPSNTTALGQELFKYSAGMAVVPKSVRARRDVLAEIIDRVVTQTAYPASILSIACGHLRESKKSKAIQSGNIGKLIAFDQDALSLEMIDSELPYSFIETIKGSVTSIIRQNQSFKDLDLVYASGLYDYLSQSFAARLTKIMFDMLRPGGTLVVANFVPNHNEIGYMETFMQWDLIYRTEEQMEDVGREIPPNEINSKRVFLDKDSNIVFLEITKV